MGAPLRTPGFAPQRQEITPLPGGGWRLANRTPFDNPFPTTWAPLLYWARIAPRRVWMAERSARGWTELTYADAADSLDDLARGLSALGVGPGRPLLVLGRNSLHHVLLTYAAQTLGAPVAVVSPQYAQPGADPTRLAAVTRRIAPAAVFADDAQLPSIRDALPGVTILASSGRFGAPLMPLLGRDGTLGPAISRHTDTALFLMTSGSTGQPKPVACTHAGMATNMAQVAACFDDDEPPVVVNSAPWSHGIGAISQRQFVLHRGGSFYIDHGRPTAEDFGTTIDNLLTISPTHHHFVPAGWALMADALEARPDLARAFFARLKVMQYGGASLPQSVVDRLQTVARRTIGCGVCVTANFGATETGPVVANVQWSNERSGLVGLPVPGTEIRLVPAPGAKLEICVSGPQLSPGYLNGGEVSPLPRDRDGFYRFGDAGRLDEQGPPTLVFDGRLVENFKLASGTFVSAGTLRTTAVFALGRLVFDAIVCGEGQAGVGLMLFPDLGQCRRRFGDLALTDLPRHPELRRAVYDGLVRMNAAALGGSGRVLRAIILGEEPDRASGEIAEKGYLNQALCRARRPDAIARLFSDGPGDEVLVFDAAPPGEPSTA